MAGEADGGGSQREQRSSRVDVGGGSAGGTWLESGGSAERRERSSWRPSRPAISGEFTPLSATGIHAGRVRRGVRARFAAAAAGLVALGALGLFWLRGTSAPERDQPLVPVVEVVKLTPPTGASTQPAPTPEPRVTPIVQQSARSEAEPVTSAAARGSAPSAPRAKPDPVRPSPDAVPPRRASSSNSEPTGASRELSGGASANAPSEPGRAPALERPAMAHGDDPWNPDSFGERR
jgi:hypothetical protein